MVYPKNALQLFVSLMHLLLIKLKTFLQMMYKGIPYLNAEQEQLVTKYWKANIGRSDALDIMHRDVLRKHSANIARWLVQAREGDIYTADKSTGLLNVTLVSPSAQTPNWMESVRQKLILCTKIFTSPNILVEVRHHVLKICLFMYTCAAKFYNAVDQLTGNYLSACKECS